MNELKIFESKEFGKIRTVDIGGKIYFVGNDIAKALGYVSPKNAVARHCKGALNHPLPTNGGKQVLKVVPKGDLFRLASHSELPGAEKFESWIYDEVLPSIHENGMYVTDELLANPDFAIKVFQKLKTEQEQRIQLQQKIEQDKPYTEFGQAITHSNAAVTVNDYAKALNNANIDIGRNRLFKWFREEEYLCRSKADYNRPKQAYIDQGLFEVKENPYNTRYRTYVTFTPLITGKGQKYFYEKLRLEKKFTA